MKLYLVKYAVYATGGYTLVPKISRIVSARSADQAEIKLREYYDQEFPDYEVSAVIKTITEALT